MSGLLNKKATKSLILKRTKKLRQGWDCERVSLKVINQIEADLRIRIDKAIQRHPTKGKTFLYYD